jgi:hypothetical protein
MEEIFNTIQNILNKHKYVSKAEQIILLSVINKIYLFEDIIFKYPYINFYYNENNISKHKCMISKNLSRLEKIKIILKKI